MRLKVYLVLFFVVLAVGVVLFWLADSTPSNITKDSRQQSGSIVPTVSNGAFSEKRVGSQTAIPTEKLTPEQILIQLKDMGEMRFGHTTATFPQLVRFAQAHKDQLPLFLKWAKGEDGADLAARRTAVLVLGILNQEGDLKKLYYQDSDDKELVPYILAALACDPQKLDWQSCTRGFSLVGGGSPIRAPIQDPEVMDIVVESYKRSADAYRNGADIFDGSLSHVNGLARTLLCNATVLTGRHTEDLLQIAQDESLDSLFRIVAFGALESINNDAIPNRLIDTIRKAQDPLVRKAMYGSIGRETSSPFAIEQYYKFLQQAAGAEGFDVRTDTFIDILMRNDHAEVRDQIDAIAVKELQSNPSPDFRKDVASSIWRRDDPTIRDGALTALSNEKNPKVQTAIIHSLQQMQLSDYDKTQFYTSLKNTLQNYSADEKVYLSALDAFTRLWPNDAPAYLELARQNSPSSAVQAKAQALLEQLQKK